MPDPLTEKLAAKIVQKGPQPPATLTKPPEGPPDVAAGAQKLFQSWQPTTDEGKRYKEELGSLLGAPVPGPEATPPPPM